MALIRPIAEGLDRAHKAGVLHRDIKPANIIVGPDGRPVLIDFGSARFESSQATNTKVTFYTPPYAAIEQYVKSYPQGPWTDIYALGVVMYQCVTGEKPPEVLERMHAEEGQPLSAQRLAGLQPGVHARYRCGDGDPPAGAACFDHRLAETVRWERTTRPFDDDAGTPPALSAPPPVRRRPLLAAIPKRPPRRPSL